MSLVSQRGSVFTPDTAEAIRTLEEAGGRIEGLRLSVSGTPGHNCNWPGVQRDPGPTGLPPEISMRPTGREVYLEVQGSGRTRQEDLALLWGLVVPLGFMPLCRYPLPGPGDQVFHFMGPWAPMVDFLNGEGRGEEAWPSLCAAAQIEVGKWGGGREVERGVQAHLHRLGVPCGPVDGRVGEKTLAALKSMGFGGKPLSDVYLDILGWDAPRAQPSKGEARHGSFAIPGRKVTGVSFGQVYLTRTATGYVVSAEGPGKATFLIGGRDE